MKDWVFGLTSNGVLSGLKKYGLSMILASVIVSVSFIIGLQPLDNKPSVERLIIEGVVYYIGVGLGIYFGTVYVKTRNLWVPIILHFIVNVGTAIIFCFTTSNEYPMMALITCLVVYCGLGIYGISIIKKTN